MKKIGLMILIVAMVVLPGAAGSVSAPFGYYEGHPVARVLVDGSPVAFEGDVPAHVVLSRGRTLVPLRFVSEAMGAQVAWDQESFTVSVTTQTAQDERRLAAIESTTSELRREVDDLRRIVNELLNERPTTVVEKVQPSVVGILAVMSYPGAEETMSQGTGFVWNAAGLIVTNTHVVRQRDLVTGDVFVIFNDGFVGRAVIESFDYLSDVALLRVNRQGLRAATLGDSRQLKVGQEVVAIGNPLSLGLRNTVTAGVISGINRADQSAYPLIQTDAAINSGNSGGPLVNYKGEVIGITSAKIAAFGVEGLGFAIPIHIVQDIISRFVDGGIKRPFLGVVIEESAFASLGVPGGPGLTVVELSPGGPARATGILVDDVITHVNGVAVSSLVDLRTQLERYAPGAIVTIGIRRGQRTSTVTLTLGTVGPHEKWPFEIGAIYPWEAEF